MKIQVAECIVGVALLCLQRSVGFSIIGSRIPTESRVRRYSTTASTVEESEEETLQIQSETLKEYREAGHPIAVTFSPTEFKPLPWLTNCHIQTIGGVYLRSLDSCKYVTDAGLGLLQQSLKHLVSVAMDNSEMVSSPDREGFWDERQRFATPDDDFFDVDFKYQLDAEIPSEKGMVILLHGLQSSSKSSLSVDLAMAFMSQGFDVACLNFRSCSGTMNKKIAGYHLGFTDDVKQFLGVLKEKGDNDSNPQHPLYLSGFSLGANVALKALGELGASAYEEFSIYGAAVGGAPFDCERNIHFVQRPGFNRIAYNGSLLKSLKQRSLEQLDLFPDSDEAKRLDREQIMNAKTIADIENAVIAPVYGFQDNIDYYRQTKCDRFLNNITVPTLIINAKDDPFFDPSYFPLEKSSDLNKNSPIRMIRTEHGGHLGHMFHQEDSREVDVVKTIRKSPTGERPSWMPLELSRFLSHAHKNRAVLNEVRATYSAVDDLVNIR